MPGRQPRKGLVEQLAVGETGRDIDRGWCVDRRELDLDHPPLAAPDEIETRIGEQPLQPGVEPVRIAETGQVAPSADHRLLDGVARELAVAEDQAGGRVQPREAPVDEVGEGVMLALPRSLDESSLVHGRLECGTSRVVVLDRVWRPCRWKGSVRCCRLSELEALYDPHRLGDVGV